MDHKELEEGNKLSLDFTKLKKVADCPEDLLPAVAQDADTGEVLIVGYANELALKTTFKENMATFGAPVEMNFGLKEKPQATTLKL